MAALFMDAGSPGELLHPDEASTKKLKLLYMEKSGL